MLQKCDAYHNMQSNDDGSDAVAPSPKKRGRERQKNALKGRTFRLPVRALPRRRDSACGVECRPLHFASKATTGREGVLAGSSTLRKPLLEPEGVQRARCRIQASSLCEHSANGAEGALAGSSTRYASRCWSLACKAKELSGHGVLPSPAMNHKKTRDYARVFLSVLPGSRRQSSIT